MRGKKIEERRSFVNDKGKKIAEESHTYNYDDTVTSAFSLSNLADNPLQSSLSFGDTISQTYY